MKTFQKFEKGIDVAKYCPVRACRACLDVGLINCFSLVRFWEEVGERFLPCLQWKSKMTKNDIGYKRTDKCSSDIHKGSVCLFVKIY